MYAIITIINVDTLFEVLSDSVAKALPLVVGNRSSETARFASMFDSFFDLLNVTNFTNGTRYRKPFQHPYHHADDQWLEICILNVFPSTHFCGGIM